MLKAYINYPVPHVEVHQKTSCPEIQKRKKPGQRLVRIDATSISSELGRFSAGQYRFASNAPRNDMWLEVDFGDAEFETAVIAYVQRLIGKRYSPLARAPIDSHPCPEAST